jgi:hypothetical protein
VCDKIQQTCCSSVFACIACSFPTFTIANRRKLILESSLQSTNQLIYGSCTAIGLCTHLHMPPNFFFRATMHCQALPIALVVVLFDRSHDNHSRSTKIITILPSTCHLVFCACGTRRHALAVLPMPYMLQCGSNRPGSTCFKIRFGPSHPGS